MMNNSFSAVIFDLDGVLVFTDEYHCRSWKFLADKMGWDFSEELNHKLRGIPRLASLQVILEHNNITVDPSRKFEYTRIKNECYLQMLRDELSRNDMYPGALELLEKLKQRGIPMALCSSSKNARTVVEKLGIKSYFSALVSGNDIERAKPEPDIFLLGAQKLGVPPEQCIVFEDAESGIKAAHAAGMRAIGVGCTVSAPNADQRIRNYDDLDVDKLLKTGEVR